MTDDTITVLPVPEPTLGDLTKRVAQLEAFSQTVVGYINGLIQSQQIAERLYAEISTRTEHMDQTLVQISRRQKRHGSRTEGSTALGSGPAGIYLPADSQ